GSGSGRDEHLVHRLPGGPSPDWVHLSVPSTSSSTDLSTKKGITAVESTGDRRRGVLRQPHHRRAAGARGRGRRARRSLDRQPRATMFVNISTGGALYGETPVCATEATALDTPSPYGRYKAEAERLASSTAGLRTVTYRFANIYGPRQRTDLEGGVIAIFAGC